MESVSNGQCIYNINGLIGNRGATAHVVLLVLLCYISPILIFVFTYISILTFVRHSSKVCHVTAAPGGGHAQQISKSEMNVFKTCILVSVMFVVCWFLDNFVYLMSVVDQPIIDNNIYLSYIGRFLGFVNICFNPFLYALSMDGVKKQLMSMFVACTQLQTSFSSLCSTVARVKGFRVSEASTDDGECGRLPTIPTSALHLE